MLWKADAGHDDAEREAITAAPDQVSGPLIDTHQTHYHQVQGDKRMMQKHQNTRFKVKAKQLNDYKTACNND